MLSGGGKGMGAPWEEQSLPWAQIQSKHSRRLDQVCIRGAG